MTNLDTATIWLYPLFLLTGLVLSGCLSVLVKRVQRQGQTTCKDQAPYVLITIASSITLVVCFQAMFLRFHGVEVKPDRIELVYVWPRPRSLISVESFERAEVSLDRSGKGDIKVITKEGTFRSAVFSRTINAEEVKSSLEKWAMSHR